MLNTTPSPQPCSSSPIRLRAGSADRVVLPVPDKPKNNVVSPSSPTLAAQCIGKTSCAGNRKFCTENMAFFISPAYCIPASNTFFAAKLIITQPSELVPSRSGTHSKKGALIICHCSLPPALNASGVINKQRPNRLCHAVVVVILTGK